MKGPRITLRAPREAAFDAAGLSSANVARWRLTALAFTLSASAIHLGCVGSNGQHETQAKVAVRTRLVVIAPVVNMSGSRDFDPLKLTDFVASEVLSFPGLASVPVNMTLAALARQGKTQVDTAETAIGLARELGADMTIVVGVTEFNPYHPPVIGMIMQVYVPRELEGGSGLDPVGASRSAAPSSGGAQLVADLAAPRMQLQRVFNGSANWVRDEVQLYAEARDGGQSPLGWRRHLRSQELYARYCAWSLIRSMLRQEAIDDSLDMSNEVK